MDRETTVQGPWVQVLAFGIIVSGFIAFLALRNFDGYGRWGKLAFGAVLLTVAVGSARKRAAASK